MAGWVWAIGGVAVLAPGVVLVVSASGDGGMGVRTANQVAMAVADQPARPPSTIRIPSDLATISGNTKRPSGHPKFVSNDRPTGDRFMSDGVFSRAGAGGVCVGWGGEGRQIAVGGIDITSPPSRPPPFQSGASRLTSPVDPNRS